MNTIKMKIKKYDEESNSIIVCFSSDETATDNPDNYTEYAFQPTEMYPDITDMEMLKRRIAEQGIALANQQKAKEDAKQNTTMINAWKAIVGQTFEYNVKDIVNSSSEFEVNYVNEVQIP